MKKYMEERRESSKRTLLIFFYSIYKKVSADQGKKIINQQYNEGLSRQHYRFHNIKILRIFYKQFYSNKSDKI